MAVGSEISKPVFIAGVVAAILIVGALGYYFVKPHGNSIPADVRQKYMDHMKTNPSTYTNTQHNTPNTPNSGGGTYGVYSQGSGGGH